MIWSDNVHRPELERIHRKTEKREAVREKKAESAAKLEKSIENELLERLKKGTYGDIYNFAPEEFNNMLDENEEEIEMENEEEDEDVFIEDMDEDEDVEDADTLGALLKPSDDKKYEINWIVMNRPSSSSHVEIEYEEEEEDPELEEN